MPNTSAVRVESSYNPHKAALMARHRALDALIASARQQPGYDDAYLAALKKKKLRLRDEINADS